MKIITIVIGFVDNICSFPFWSKLKGTEAFLHIYCYFKYQVTNYKGSRSYPFVISSTNLALVG